MSIQLTILTALVALLALVAFLRPATLFQYPVAASLLMWFFIIPQAWRIEASGALDDYEPTLTWGYMILCTVCTVIGFYAGNARAVATKRNGIEQLLAVYDPARLFHGALALMALGGFAIIMINRMAATMEPGTEWTGAIAFYAFVATLFVYGTALAWLLYLYTKDKKALVLAAGGMAMNVPVILLSARRETAFLLLVILLLGWFFVRKKSLSRLIFIPMILVGSVLVNQAGTLRAYIKTNDATLVDAIAATSNDEVAETPTGGADYSEVGSAIYDITIAKWSENYAFVMPYYNCLISYYVPAFIVGRDVKDGLKAHLDDGSEDKYQRTYWGGATHTGFADSFQAFHYFGCLIFLAIAYIMGSLWKRAMSGDIKAQLYYMMLLSVGLKVFTEATSIFFGILPLMFLSMGGVFWYARRRKAVARSEPVVDRSTRLVGQRETVGNVIGL